MWTKVFCLGWKEERKERNQSTFKFLISTSFWGASLSQQIKLFVHPPWFRWQVAADQLIIAFTFHLKHGKIFAVLMTVHKNVLPSYLFMWNNKLKHAISVAHFICYRLNVWILAIDDVELIEVKAKMSSSLNVTVCLEQFSCPDRKFGSVLPLPPSPEKRNRRLIQVGTFDKDDDFWRFLVFYLASFVILSSC
jgi:hypothetical protein